MTTFIHDNLSLIITFVVFVVVLLLAYVGVPYLRKKGILTEKNAQTAEEILSVAKLVLENINTSNAVKDVTGKIFNVADIAVRYAEQTMASNGGADKKNTAIQISKDVLSHMGISVDDKTMKLLDVGIEAAVNLLPKQTPAPVVNVANVTPAADPAAAHTADIPAAPVNENPIVG